MASHTTTAVFQRGGIAGRPAASAFGGLVGLVVATRNPSFHPRRFACKRVRTNHRVAKGCEEMSSRLTGPMSRSSLPRDVGADPCSSTPS
jgi:hypothetical protein